MNGDLEIESWRKDWQAQDGARPKSPVDIRRAAIRQQRRLRTAHVVELFVAVSFLLFSAAVAWRNPEPETFLWTAAVWASTAVATAFSTYNWRILWKANLKSVSEYETAYKNRCVATLKAVRFGMAFLAVQVTVSTVWFSWDYLRHRVTAGTFALALALIAGLAQAIGLFFQHYRRAALRELDEMKSSQM